MAVRLKHVARSTITAKLHPSRPLVLRGDGTITVEKDGLVRTISFDPSGLGDKIYDENNDKFIVYDVVNDIAALIEAGSSFASVDYVDTTTAPIDAEYVVKTASSRLTAERVLTDGAAAGKSNWDWSVSGTVKGVLYASAADKMLYSTGADTWSEAAITSAGRALLDDATAGDQRTTLGIGTADSPQFTAINLGHASDTTLSRTGAGDIAIEGNAVYRAGGTDVPVADGGTGASTAADARIALSAAQSGANTDITSIYLDNTGLKIKDTNASHGLSIVPGSNLTADRILTITTGDAARTLDISAGNVTISTAGAALIDDADASAQRTTLGLGTAATVNTGTSGATIPLNNDANTFSGANTFTATQTFSGTVDAQGAITISGDITPSQITADQNNYNPTGLSTASVVRISSDAARAVTGLDGGSDGRVLTLVNVGSFTITLNDQNASSSAANRFAIGSDIAIAANQAVAIIYDATATRWRAVGIPGTGGGGGGAPTDAEYLVKTANGTLSAERVVTDLSSAGGVVSDWATAGQWSGKLYASATDKFLYSTGANAWSEGAITAAGRALLDDATAGDQRTTLGIGTADSPQFTAINLGHASDTTITRVSAGNIAVDGNAVYRAGGTDVALADGGTGASLTDPNADRIMFWDDSAGSVTWLTAGTGLTITNTTIDATSGLSAASQNEMEAASSTTVAVTPGRLIYDPAHLKAGIVFYYSFSTHSTVSSVNTTTDVVTTAGVHSLSTGDIICCGVSAPSGWGDNTFYYCNVASTTTFTLHSTYSNAVAGINKIDLTSAGSGTRTVYRYDVTILWSYNAATAQPIVPKIATGWGASGSYSVSTTTGSGQLRFTFNTPLSSTSNAYLHASKCFYYFDSASIATGQPTGFANFAVSNTAYTEWKLNAYDGATNYYGAPCGSDFVCGAFVYGDM